MEELLLEILNELRASQANTGAPAPFDEKRLLALIRRRNEGCGQNRRPFAKKYLLPFYLRIKESEPERWTSWNVDDALEQQLVQALRMKPNRTASGVATITVLTKPWPCSGECLYCPNDLRMPKSYLADEPACQRAERNWFDPYLQVAGRLHALIEMGHTTDKVELIVLGGTWTDYPESYRTWFIRELFRALNDADAQRQAKAQERRAHYREQGIANTASETAAFVAAKQLDVREGRLTYNRAVAQLYQEAGPWSVLESEQRATLEEVEAAHLVNETAAHRCVGLVVETRPDAITPESLTHLRALGCTKVQVGIQSTDPSVLEQNTRATSIADLERAFALLRLFGFKTHVHAMVNLYGSTAAQDLRDYRRLVEHVAYLPDEVKLYPCVLVDGTQLMSHAKDGSWQPYDEKTLVDVLAADVVATPPYTRISRMIRDISAHDIVAGNKKTNLRQMVEAQVERTGAPIAEIRHREIGANAADPSALTLTEIPYRTTMSRERFLQWTTPDDRIAGFLRLSLPDVACLQAYAGRLPVQPYEAMIREVHVYGRVASLHGGGQNAQHLGLGRRLVERACAIAHAEGYTSINVISAVGTREYYRHLGFSDHGLYQRKELG